MTTIYALPTWAKVIGGTMAVMSVMFIILVAVLIDWFTKISKPREADQERAWADKTKVEALDRPKTVARKAVKNALPIILDKGAYVPFRAHRTDAGLDLFAMESGVIPPFSHAMFDTGVHIALPSGTVGLITSKSGLMANGITSRGTIDENYRGSIKAVLYNHTDKPFTVERGVKITQLVILPILTPTPTIVDSLDETDRGFGGFGSTGK